jgi:uncharacterized protein (DUF952 family)
MIYHITARAQWQAAQSEGLYQGDTLATQGFIHASDLHQVLGTANRFYAGQPNLVLLCVDPARLTPELRYEEADGQRFPHLYGPLNLDAVAQVLDFPPNADGTFTLPPQLDRPG